MPKLPAICDTCGTIFPSGYSVSGGGTMSAYGNISGPCPRCKGMGHVPDGQYKAIAEGLSANLVNFKDIDALKKLSQLLNTAINENNITSIKDNLKKEAPNWKNVWNLLPEENIGNSIAIYMFILAMLQTAITLYSLSKPVEQNIIINQSYEYFYNLKQQLPNKKQDKENKLFHVNPLTDAIRRKKF